MLRDLTEKEWSSVTEELTKTYGEDMAQQVILRLFELEEKGRVINPVLPLARKIAKDYRTDEIRKSWRLCSLDTWLTAREEEDTVPENFIDHSDPEVLLMGRERAVLEEKILANLPMPVENMSAQLKYYYVQRGRKHIAGEGW